MTHYVIRPEAVLPANLPAERISEIELHIWQVFKVPSTDLFSHLFTDFIGSVELGEALEKSGATGVECERVKLRFTEKDTSTNTVAIDGVRLVIKGSAFKDDFAVDGTELIVSEMAVNLLKSYRLGKIEIVPINEHELRVRRGLFKACSFCGALVECADLFTGPRASICRVCVLQLIPQANGDHEELPKCSFCMREPGTAVAGHTDGSICAFHLDMFRNQLHVAGIA
jgi:hypothetical protein